MQHISAQILSNVSVASGYYAMDFLLPTGAREPFPGQFLTIRTSQTHEPLLRRPFAVSDYDRSAGRAQFIYQLRGPATALLSGMTEGDELDVLWPLGNRFPEPSSIEGPVKDDSSRFRRPVLLAGGIGMGPMFFFAKYLKDRELDPLLIIGARSADLIPCSELLPDVSCIICSDDGSIGQRGNVLQALETELARETEISPSTENPSSRTLLTNKPEIELYACGPHPMLAAAANWAADNGAPLWVSMEQTMGCAVGACMGCAVERREKGQYARVCADGPIFDYRELSWD